jgi:hypothetical protein
MVDSRLINGGHSLPPGMHRVCTWYAFGKTVLFDAHYRRISSHVLDTIDSQFENLTGT